MALRYDRFAEHDRIDNKGYGDTMDLYWTERCIECEVFKTKPHEFCVKQNPHNKAKNNKNCFVCKNINKCKEDSKEE